MEKAGEAAADRAHTRFIVSDDPDEVVEQIARLRRPRASPSSSSTSPGTTRRARSAPSPTTCCRVCATASGFSPSRPAVDQMSMSRARARELWLPVLLVVVILGATIGAAHALHDDRGQAPARRRRRPAGPRGHDHRRLVPRAARAPRAGRRGHRGGRRRRPGRLRDPHPPDDADARGRRRRPRSTASPERDRARWEREQRHRR